MASGTTIRLLSRLLDASESPCWVIDRGGAIAYVSGAAAEWLGIEADSLLSRKAVRSAVESSDPYGRLAASLAPPPSLGAGGFAVGRVQPLPLDGRTVADTDAIFVRVGDADSGFVIAVAGTFESPRIDPALAQSDHVRSVLDAWRKKHRSLATIATAGVSPSARRLRTRLQVAAATRTHLGIFGPPGSGAESIAMRIHQQSAAGEPIATVEGSLMDAELLDATLAPLIHQLADSASARVTALVRSIDEMPVEAQDRLSELVTTYGGRLRLITLAGPTPSVLAEPLADQSVTIAVDDDVAAGIRPRLIETICGLVVTLTPLASRVEDIPLLAAAALDARHAAGEGPAKHLSQNAIDAMLLYPWPGNFVELDQAIGHAIGRATGQSISVDQLPLAIRSFRVGGMIESKPTSFDLDQHVRQYELRLIQQAVEAVDGNRAEAARRLGISRARLLRRLDGESER